MAGAAVRRRRHPRHHRGDARRVARAARRARRRPPPRGAAAPASPTSRSSRATASTSRPSSALVRGRRRAHRRRHLPRRPRRPRRVRRPRGRLRRARLRRDARRLRAARPLDRRLLRGAAPSTPTSRAPCSRPAARAGLGLRVHGNQLGPGPGVRLAVELGAASVDHCTYLDRRRRRGARRRRHRRDVPARHRLLDPPALPRRAPGDRRRRAPSPIATNCNPGSSYTTSMALLPRARRARPAHDRRRGAAGRHPRRRPRPAPHRRRPPRARRPRRRRRPRRAVPRHLVYRPGVPLVAATIAGGEVLHRGG